MDEDDDDDDIVSILTGVLLARSPWHRWEVPLFFFKWVICSLLFVERL